MTLLLSDPVATDCAPTLDVDLAAVAANTRLLATRAAAGLMAVVKADGFGHGAGAVARTALAHGAGSLGVTTVAEALALRAEGITAPLLSWLNPVDTDFGSALRAGIDLAVPSPEHLQAVCRAAAETGCAARVHLHVDTGMARDGAPLDAWPQLCRLAEARVRQGLVEVVGVMGHLGFTAPADNAAGRAAFVTAVGAASRAGLRPMVRHLAATAATLTDPGTHFDLCRAGAGLVGIDLTGSGRLRPAMTLTAPVVGVRRVPAGTGVGYGHTQTTARRTHLALLPLGYADGIPRAASGRGEVLLRGRRCPVIGLVSMDQLVVDVGDAPVQPGEVATVFGPGDDGEPTARDWAAWAGTIEHEIVTGIGSRVRRRLAPVGQR